jgi:hypothetical protein
VPKDHFSLGFACHTYAQLVSFFLRLLAFSVIKKVEHETFTHGCQLVAPVFVAKRKKNAKPNERIVCGSERGELKVFLSALSTPRK